MGSKNKSEFSMKIKKTHTLKMHIKFNLWNIHLAHNPRQQCGEGRGGYWGFGGGGQIGGKMGTSVIVSTINIKLKKIGFEWISGWLCAFLFPAFVLTMYLKIKNMFLF